jgi:hypothetical protein
MYLIKLIAQGEIEVKAESTGHPLFRSPRGMAELSLVINSMIKDNK